MQSSMIPWHIFMTALAKQRGSKVTNWLGRWRFANDGVFMAHESVDVMEEFRTPDGSGREYDKAEKVVN